MTSPNVATHLRQRLGETLFTITGKPKRLLYVTDTEATVATSDSPEGAPLRLVNVQRAVDRVYAGEEVAISQASVGGSQRVHRGGPEVDA